MAYVLAHEPGGGGGGEAPRNLIAELDADAGSSARAPRVLVFDSGLGGLTVLAGIRRRVRSRTRLRRRRRFFPYGALSEAALVERVDAVMDDLIARTRPTSW